MYLYIESSSLIKPLSKANRLHFSLPIVRFESLSLSNCGEALQETFKRSELDPLLHPPVQSAQVQQEQHLQQQQQQQHLDREQELRSITPVQLEQKQSTLQLLHQPQQRLRAKSSPPESSCIVLQQFVQAPPSQGGAGGQNHGSSSVISSPTIPLHGQDYLTRSSLLHLEQIHTDPGAKPSNPSSNTSFSPLSAPVSPLPSIFIGGVDISMMMVDGASEADRTLVAMSDQEPVNEGNTTSASAVKVLNIRQRKWNSVSKEWQEWQDVQATHTPNISPPPVQIHQMQLSKSNSSIRVDGKLRTVISSSHCWKVVSFG